MNWKMYWSCQLQDRDTKYIGIHMFTLALNYYGLKVKQASNVCQRSAQYLGGY